MLTTEGKVFFTTSTIGDLCIVLLSMIHRKATFKMAPIYAHTKLTYLFFIILYIKENTSNL